jgi:hypothetical protein
VHFGPGLLEDKHPKLVFIGLAEEWFADLVHRDEVVDDDLLYLAVDEHGHLVDACRVVALLTEDGLHAFLVFGDGCEGGEEVAIAEVALDDLGGFDGGGEEDGIGDDFGDSLPVAVADALDVPETAF